MHRSIQTLVKCALQNGVRLKMGTLHKYRADEGGLTLEGQPAYLEECLVVSKLP
jgi:hypothetical protein